MYCCHASRLHRGVQNLLGLDDVRKRGRPRVFLHIQCCSRHGFGSAWVRLASSTTSRPAHFRLYRECGRKQSLAGPGSCDHSRHRHSMRSMRSILQRRHSCQLPLRISNRKHSFMESQHRGNTPTCMVKLIALVWHVRPVDDLQIESRGD